MENLAQLEHPNHSYVLLTNNNLKVFKVPAWAASVLPLFNGAIEISVCSCSCVQMCPAAAFM